MSVGEKMSGVEVKTKEKRRVSAWKVFNEITNYGDLKDENEQVNELPPVGTRVVVLDKYSYERAQGNEMIIAVYRADPSFHDKERGVYNKIYRIESYTKGIENLYASNNLIILKEERTGIKKSIKANSVVTGSMKLRVVDEGYVEKKDRSILDTTFSTEIAEYSAYKTRDMRKEAGCEE